MRKQDIPSDSKSISSEPEDTVPFRSPKKTLQQSPYIPILFHCTPIVKTLKSHYQPASPVDEIKYIVFASSLMVLFKQYTSCYNECIDEVAYQKSTFIAVRQHCEHQRVCRSQPHIKDTLAGKFILSAVILYSVSNNYTKIVPIPKTYNKQLNELYK